MDQSLKVPNIKTEPTDSTSNDRLEIPNEMQVDYLVQSEISIKTEPEEDESDFLVIAGTSLDMCHNVEVKLKTIDEILDNACENLFNETLQDTSENSNEIKDKTTLNKRQRMGERKSSEMKNIKNESTNTTSTGDMQMKCVKEESCPLHMELDIKMEPQEDEEYFSIDLNQGRSGKTDPIEEEKNQIFLESDEDFDSHESASNLQDPLLNRINPHHKNKNYICNECNKIFKWKSRLDEHLRIHRGEKPFSCEICKKAFRHKSTLHIHMLTHSGEKPHSCDICQKVFSQKANLIGHMLIHSGVKQFSCNVCKKSFTRKPDLLKHERIHTGHKPFICDLCQKAFTWKSTLTTHKRTHTGEKPYSCDICKKLFADKRNLNKHKNIHKK